MESFPTSKHISEQHRFDMQRYINQLCIQHFDIDEEIAKDNVIPLPVKETPDDICA